MANGTTPKYTEEEVAKFAESYANVILMHYYLEHLLKADAKIGAESLLFRIKEYREKVPKIIRDKLLSDEKLNELEQKCISLKNNEIIMFI